MADDDLRMRLAWDIVRHRGIFPIKVAGGWSVWCTTPHHWPACLFGVARSDVQFQPSKWPGPWPCPVEAIIEAEKWYQEHAR